MSSAPQDLSGARRRVQRPLSAWLASLAIHAACIASAIVLAQLAPRGSGVERPIELELMLAGPIEVEAPPAEPVEVSPITSPVETPPVEIAPVETAPMLPEPTEPQSPLLAAAKGEPATPLASALASRYLPKPPGASRKPVANKSGSRESEPRETVGSGGGLAALDLAGRTRVSVFGVTGEGRKFVYAFDRSASMSGAPLAAAKRQLVASFETLDSTHQFQILFFNHKLSMPTLIAGRQRIAFANETAQQAARQFVESIEADGGTDRYVALRRAILLGPDVIFFLTDADDAMTNDEMEDIAELNNRYGATICSIEFGRGPSLGKRNFLTHLAELTGGEYVYVDTARLVER